MVRKMKIKKLIDAIKNVEDEQTRKVLEMIAEILEHHEEDIQLIISKLMEWEGMF